MTFQIQIAKREKTNTLTALVGPSGSGKTYSAILLARGLVGQSGKIGLLDTENRRALHYADLAGGFDHAEFQPPFSPKRYIEAMESFEKAGYHVLIIDSMSHEWDGEGGVLDLHDQIVLETGKDGLNTWKRPKLEHKNFVRHLLQARMHIIMCFRAKDKLVTKHINGRSELVNEGLVPITDTKLLYEMTAAVMLDPETHGATHIKVGAALAGAFTPGKLIGFESGQALRKWSEEGVAVDLDRELFIEAAREEARKGLAALTEWSKGVDKAYKATLAAHREELGSIARAADEATEMAAAITETPDEKVMELSP